MFNEASPGKGWKAWSSLFRPPNLLTVPGDPLAGALLAAASIGLVPPLPPLLSTMGAALCLYAGGLLANDFFDRTVDALERPTRPIPSGAVNANRILIAALLLTLAGLFLAAEGGKAALLIASLLAAASWFYNAIGKRIAWLAPLNMGLCRGLSLLMGAAIMGSSSLAGMRVVIASALLTAFTAAITLAARNEARTDEFHRCPKWLACCIPLVLTAGLASLIHETGLALVFATMAVFWATVWSINLAGADSPAATQRAIGGLIRGLILVQSALCAASGPTGEACAILLLLAFPVSGWLGKWFYGS